MILNNKRYGSDYGPSSLSRQASFMKRTSTILLLAALLATVTYRLYCKALVVFNPLPDHSDLFETFKWEDITPSKRLQYHACFDGWQCARLEVPLNWNLTTDIVSEKVAIAIIKKPAKVEVTDSRYGGVVLFNPGGPGGSGVSFFSRYGNAFQTILDSNRAPSDMISGALQERYFDILTWDPRGVNNTTPRHSCIPNPVAKQTWDAEGAAIGFDLQEKGVFSNVWSRGITWGKACADTDAMTALNRVNEDEHLGQYVSTANVVRDMVEIIERHGEWRENRVRKLIGTSRLRENKDDILHRTIWRKGEEQLQYWGFSYGTVLGQTFASMQPHRVGRMVLDGVVNAEDYMLNGWSKNLNDIDKITELFARTCVEVGPRRCSFYFPGEDGMILKLSDIMNTLKANPIPAIYKGVPATVTHSDLVLLIFDTWYRPLFGFRSIADRLTELSNRNGSFFAAMKYQAESETCSFSSSSQSDTASAAMAIACTDGESPNSKNQNEWRAYINLLQGQSSMFANRWAQLPLPCTGYSSVRANWRFTGPFGAYTANPIMFISETLDPVTPFRNAVNAAELFPGSVVLETEGAGHCTISMPSIEGMLAVRKYFEAGEVPANGTKFKAAMGYFEDEPMLGNLSSRSARDREMMEAAMMIAQTWPRYA